MSSCLRGLVSQWLPYSSRRKSVRWADTTAAIRSVACFRAYEPSLVPCHNEVVVVTHTSGRFDDLGLVILNHFDPLQVLEEQRKPRHLHMSGARGAGGGEGGRGGGAGGTGGE